MAQVGLSTRGLGTKPFSSKCKRVLHNIAKFCEKEALEGQVDIPITQPIKRASAMAGVSRTTLWKIRRRANYQRANCQKRAFCHRNRQKKKTIENVALDSADCDVIRRTIHEFYAVDKERPTVVKLLSVLQEKINFPRKQETLRKILLEIGFQYKKKGKLLVERSDVVLSRTRYLRSIRQFREKEKRPIVYLDETWVDGNLTFGKCWRTKDVFGAEPPQNAALQHITIVCAGGEMGFVPNANMLREASSGLLDSNLIEKWAEEKLIPNLPKNAVVVFNDAPYYSVRLDRLPDFMSPKRDVTDWLSANNVTFSPDLRKIELLDLVRRNSPQTESYKFDTMLKQHGFVALRLPPHHCDINAVEYVWAQVKRFIRQHHAMKDVDDMSNLLQCSTDAMNSVTTQDWAKYGSYVASLETIYWDSDGIVDNWSQPSDKALNKSDDDMNVSSDNSEKNYDSENNDDSEISDDSELSDDSEENDD